VADTYILAPEDAVLLNAYLDGELDRATRAQVERRLGTDAGLCAEHERLMALRQALAVGLHKEAVSDRLQTRIAAIGAPARTARPMDRERGFNWRQMAATVVLTAGLSSLLTWQLSAPDVSAIAPAALVAVHQHALLAANPVDVQSTDRHVVKPWFDAHLALSPPVVDLAADGFVLLGGRIDGVGGRSVPVMIYRHREHLVSLVAVPVPGARDAGAAAIRMTRDGFTMLTWAAADFDFAAVADIPNAELEFFVAKVRQFDK